MSMTTCHQQPRTYEGAASGRCSIAILRQQGAGTSSCTLPVQRCQCTKSKRPEMSLWTGRKNRNTDWR